MKISLKEIGITYITAPAIRKLPLNEVITVQARDEGLMQIENLVCEKLELLPAMVRSKSRKHELVIARYYIYVLARKYTKLTLNKIGSRYSGRGHDTLLSGINRLNAFIDTEKNTRRTMEYFESKLR